MQVGKVCFMECKFPNHNTISIRPRCVVCGFVLLVQEFKRRTYEAVYKICLVQIEPAILFIYRQGPEFFFGS